jgi:hypothetical protein
VVYFVLQLITLSFQGGDLVASLMPLVAIEMWVHKKKVTGEWYQGDQHYVFGFVEIVSW